MGSMPGLTITTRGVPPDAGTTNTTASGPMGGSNGRTTAGTGGGDVGAENAAPDAEDSEAPQNPDRAPSPIPRPPVSPITPTRESARLSGSDHHRHASTSTSSHSPFSNNPSDHHNNNIPIFAQGRPTFTHSQPDQIGIPPPLPQPIAFDDNPDVLALKSAITILQLQRQRATADIQALNRAKNAALADPGAFVADLAAGRIGMEGDPLLNGPGAGDYDNDNDSEDEDDEDEDDEDQNDENLKSEASSDTDNDEQNDQVSPSASSSSGSPDSQQRDYDVDGDGDIPMTNSNTTPNTTNSTTNHITRRKQPRSKNNRRINKQQQQQQPAWRTLPKPQTVVRCPPINWAQYAVVGESLDKLHREQLTAPTLGQPAVFGGGGSSPSAGSAANYGAGGAGRVYEFRGTGSTGPGIATTGTATAGAAGGAAGVGSGDITDRRTSSATPPTMGMTTEGGYVNPISDNQGQQGQGQIPRLQQQQSQRLVGIAAPYTPGRDQIDRTTTSRKGSKR
ncbi:hypothetical protein B0T20DRAFT_417936 [Sordaria brevicollis]|uniref:Uncharacterized protein n=1 Tax=Sordaria brevicollis TaxID=83679 RepID=A0AAE0UA18_SORBR|nr:hypothetical protein B0T20DRAFT_417936 [Sordaria brevicollis]